MNTRAQFYKLRPDIQSKNCLRKEAEIARRDSRFSIMSKVRKITADMSPIDSPVPLKLKPIKEILVEDKRFAMLQKYKENKKKRIEKQKEISKPIFKVQHINHSVMTDYRKIYEEIKGKSIKSQNKQNFFKIAPSSSYKFKPPANINPIQMVGIKEKINVKKKLDFNQSKQRLNFTVTPIKVKKTMENLNKSGKTPNKVSQKGINKTENYVPERKKSAISKNQTVIENENVFPRRSIRNLNTKNPNSELEIKTNASKSKNLRRNNKENKITPKKGSSKKIKDTKKSNNSDTELEVKTNTKRRNLKISNTKSVLILTDEDDEKDLGCKYLEAVGVNNFEENKTSTSSTSKSPSKSKEKTPNSAKKTSNMNNKVDSLRENELRRQTTPVVNSTESKIYISPFVTLSRGKDNARKEYHNRKSDHCGSPSFKNSQSPRAAVVYFSKLLTNETEKLRELCEEWKTYEDEVKPPEEACDMIHVAIGQTELLLKKKFKKFAELIGMCGSIDAKQKVTCLDLHAFWDIVYMQVDNLQHRFNNLDKLKTNNWEEILPPPVAKKTKKTKNKVKKPQVKSSLRDLIKEARNKKLQSEEHSVNIIVTRRLSNISNLRSNDNVLTPVNNTKANTPKSILKSTQSMTNKSKSVIFYDCDKENVFESPDLIILNCTPRRSSRLAMGKIRNEL